MLSSIEASSRQAVAEMHRLLGFLRREDDDGPEHNGRAAAPQPGLARLDELADGLRRAGLTVTVDVAGADGPLPASIDLSAYRIVQEALTNALKHGGVGTIASVEVQRSGAISTSRSSTTVVDGRTVGLTTVDVRRRCRPGTG